MLAETPPLAEQIPLLAELTPLMAEQATLLDGPIVASEDWYGSPTVIDATITEATQEWTELLAARKQGSTTDPSRQERALSGGGVPAALRKEVWLTFSGASQLLRLSRPS